MRTTRWLRVAVAIAALGPTTLGLATEAAGQGAPQQGAPQQGAPQQGAPQQGAPQQGAPQQGAPPGAPPPGAGSPSPSPAPGGSGPWFQPPPPPAAPPAGYPPAGYPPAGGPPAGSPNAGYGPGAAQAAGPPAPPPEDDDEARARDRRRSPPARLAWDEGDPIPPGYAPRRRPRLGLLIPGAVIFGTAYLPMVGAAAASDEGDEDYLPLAIPFAGPFVAMGTLPSEGAGTFWLAVDGVAQIAGATLFVTSFVAKQSYLRRVADAPLTPRAELSVGAGSASVRGSF